MKTLNARTVLPPIGAKAWIARMWPMVRRWLLPLFAALVLAMLVSHAREVDWPAAWRAAKRYDAALLVGVAVMALASHALYGSFDLIGRHQARHAVSRRRSWAIAVTSYAFNLNLGSLVGGIGLRARLYARAGLRGGQIAQVVAYSMVTNWLGYGLLAGVLFAAGLITLPADAHMNPALLRMLGVAMLLGVAGYVAGCAFSRRREWRWRTHALRLPTARLAIWQLVVSSANWALMGAMMFLLLGQQVPYGTTLAVLLAGAIAGVLVPVPGGLGVLEAVYIALLAGRVPEAALVGAVLTYRALYYLLPLGIGLVVYGVLERWPRSPAISAG